MEIKDKVIIITGGGSGIGKATALIFADEGCDIAIVDFNIEKAQETAEEIRSKGRV
ncbi:MAG TPA: SDR family NAD(P)-dependent oxidoreductase [candidate division CPR3 bacterium]|uniref:SDR family NAD(P)-dependent oxidoreductase n=1 Tax=candidate division CPR3 bacterium TaxID=2268181 RepID=A0A7C1NZ62_UNCC3|nr:SDR family NAD(P)-dependent oxidoreductase [candidate division CPR3 bacterium]